MPPQTPRVTPEALSSLRRTSSPGGPPHFLLATESQLAYAARAVKKESTRTCFVLQGQCAGADVCPLSLVQAGATVYIKQLSTTPEVTDRLRELGFCERQKIKLLVRESSYICQVCNARVGISQKMAEAILVEAASAPPPRWALKQG